MDFCYANNPNSLFLFCKYAKLVTSFANTQLGKDFLGHQTLKLPKHVFVIPNGYIQRDGENLFTLRVTPIDVYGRKLSGALRVLDVASVFLSDFNEAQKLFLGQLGLISNREFLPLLLKLPHFATYTGSPQTGGGGGNVTTCQSCNNAVSDSTYASLHDALAGTAVDILTTNSASLSSSGVANKWNNIRRNFQSYDLTVMGVGATVSGSPTIALFVPTSGTDQSLTGQSYNFYNSTLANKNNVVTGDFDQAGTTAQATAIAGSSITENATKTWTLNATGIARLQAAAGAVVEFSWRLVSDATNLEPTWASAVTSRVGFNQPADANPPLLTATYTVPAEAILFSTAPLQQLRFYRNQIVGF